jgi:dinuclear metal center YbgI/SA1388 family protein
MTTIQEITNYLEELAPRAYQESYDNAGLLLGQPHAAVTNVLVTLDVTEAVIDEAIAKNCNLIVAHHPVIFKGLKKLNGSNYTERSVIKALKNDVAVYATHTNLDNVTDGVNFMIAKQLGLQNVKILAPKKEILLKLVSFVPLADTERVLNALYNAGAGKVGNYDRCSFRVEGTGTFRPNEQANPVIGQRNQQEEVAENRFEVIFPAFMENRILAALRQAHPYEEVAYYLTPLTNEHQQVGAGAVGQLAQPLAVQDFLAMLKKRMNLSLIKHSVATQDTVQTIAVCGGVGSFLLPHAIAAQADVFVTADYKYHEFFDADGKLMICDIGHYESEICMKDEIQQYLSKKFSNFAAILSETNTNPVRYFV